MIKIPRSEWLIRLGLAKGDHISTKYSKKNDEFMVRVQMEKGAFI